MLTVKQDLFSNKILKTKNALTKAENFNEQSINIGTISNLEKEKDLTTTRIKY